MHHPSSSSLATRSCSVYRFGMRGRCSCGSVELEIAKAPPVRMFCHCTTCQGVYQAAFGDLTAQWSRDVRVVKGEDRIRYKRFRWFPISVKRGLCADCEAPVVGHLWPSPLPISFVPTKVYVDQAVVPAASGHIFYQSRVADIHDDLPKVEGFVASELTATKWMLPALLG